MAGDRSRIARIAGGGLVLILLVWLVVLPLYDLRSGAGADIERARRDLGRMQTLAAEYARLSGERERLASAGNRTQGTLYAILDGIVRSHKMAGKVRFMKPGTRAGVDGLKEETVSMGLAGLYSDEFVRFLHQVEVGADGLFVENANIRRSKTGRLDAEITVSMAVPEG